MAVPVLLRKRDGMGAVPCERPRHVETAPAWRLLIPQAETAHGREINIW
jgi:hypothetical protein